ncbi:hypothetical protein ISCGN_019733, partial [Ixodes scapularis]
LEWLTGSQHDGDEESMEVDIGHIPEMALHFVGGETPSNVTWSYEMSTKEARQALDRMFFPFLNASWVEENSGDKTANSQGDQQRDKYQCRFYPYSSYNTRLLPFTKKRT